MKTIRELLKHAKEQLKTAGIPNYSLDAEVLMSYVINMPREKFLIRLEDTIDETEYIGLVNKRSTRYPLQYITHYQEFMSLDFYVDENVLVPRNDTEILVENVLKYCKKDENLIILDMCTGSGCIATSLAYYIKNIKILAADISKAALRVANKNAQINGVSAKIDFIESNLFSEINDKKLDIIVSNPPYISKNEINTLDIAVKDHEPRLALDGGDDGLDFYRLITEQGKEFLKHKGAIFYEIGCNQAESVTNILKNNGFEKIEVIKDLAGLDRVVWGEKM